MLLFNAGLAFFNSVLNLHPSRLFALGGVIFFEMKVLLGELRIRLSGMPLYLRASSCPAANVLELCEVDSEDWDNAP